MADRDSVAAGAPVRGTDSEKPARKYRILHVLAVSLPYLNGYTVRSKYIVETQRREGFDPVVATSPFYPGVEAAIKDAVISGVSYRRIPHPVDVTRGLAFSEKLCRFLHKLRGGSGVRLRVRPPGNLVMRFLRASWHGANRLLDRRAALAREGGPGAWKYVKMAPLIVLYPFLIGIQWMGKVVRAVRFNALSYASIHIVFRIIFLPIRAVVLLIRLALDALKRLADVAEESLLLRRFERELVRISAEVKPDIIHAHSPYRCGAPALKAARRLGIPMVYEVRGLWEESSVATGRFDASSGRYRSWKRSEAKIMRQADAVVAICEQLRQEVIARGAAPERVFVVPNAADTSVFHRDGPVTAAAVPASVADVRARLRPHTVGYVGSIRKLEGVDELVKAVAVMTRRGHDVSLLVVGDGPDLPGLKTLAEQEGLGERAVFTGRVSHDLVTYFYDLMDVFVISRPRLRVTEMVTPLKPLEAMAMGKALVISDLPSLREIVKEHETGLVYSPGKPEDLADKCVTLLEDRALRERLGQAAQKWVEQERTWSAVLKGLGPAYEAARRNSPKAGVSR